MNYREAKRLFDERFTFSLKDRAEASQAWCIFIDTLHRDGQITDNQVQSWDNPFHE